MHCFHYSLTPLRSPAHYQLSDPIPSSLCTCVQADSIEVYAYVHEHTTQRRREVELVAASSRYLPHTSAGPQQQLSPTHAQLRSRKGLWS